MNSLRFELNTTYTARHSERDYLVRCGDALTVVDIDRSAPGVSYGIQSGQCYFRVSEVRLLELLAKSPDSDLKPL